jgi:hypothetical protein
MNKQDRRLNYTNQFKNKSNYEDKHLIIEKDISSGINWNNLLIGTYLLNIVILIYIFFNVKKFNWLYFILLANAIIFTGIRGIYPVLEGEKKCMYNNATPLVTRSCATIAEVSFGILIVLMVINMLKFIQKKDKNSIFTNLEKICYIIISFPIISNLNCWMGVSTNDNLFNSIEESLWTVYAVVLLAIMSFILKNLKSNIPKFNLINTTCISGIILLVLYISYMIIFDIPLYLKRYLYLIEDSNVEKLNDGLRSMFECKNVTNKYSDWSSEIIWMTSYFTIWMFLLFGIYYINSQFI